VAGGEELGDHDVAGDSWVCGAADEVAGVVVEPVEDFYVGAVGQVPVGEVGLPAFVGLGGLEPVVGGARSLSGLGDDQGSGVQDAADGRGRGCAVALFAQVPGDGDGAGIEAVACQL